jgi:hypothetical protein
MPYGAIMQEYLFSKAPTQENVRKLYMLMRDKNFQELMERTDRIENYIAKSIAISDELVVQIIQDLKDGKWYGFKQRTIVDMVRNPKIKESLKIQLLNVGRQSIMDLVTLGKFEQPGRPLGRGIWWNISGRSFSRQLVKAAKEGLFSDKLVKYMIDTGVFDPEYTQILAGKETKRTGRRPEFENMIGAQKQATLEKIRKMANDDFDGGQFSQDIFEQELKKVNTLQEDIKIYLKRKKRPFGNIEDVDPKDLILMEQWIDSIKKENQSNF